MPLNHSKSIKTVLSLLCISYSMHSSDATVLINLMSCTIPACFQYFFQSTMVPTLVENS